jgi:DNA-binding IclR family transcriptional regulator
VQNFEPPAERPAYTIDAVDNALRVLLMLRERSEVRVTDVSDELGVARSTAHRLLATLSHHGFVRQEAGSRSYRAGSVLVEIALAASGRSDIRPLARPHLAQLAARLHETVNLLVLEGDNVRFVDGVESDQPVRVTVRTGALMPAHSTSGGKVLLAELAPHHLHALYPEGPRRVTDRTITDLRELEEELAAVRREGYATNVGENEIGLNACAVPIRDRSGTVHAALVASLPAARLGPMQTPRLVQQLKQTAATIGAALAT